jgi:hypothetical protein
MKMPLTVQIILHNPNFKKLRNMKAAQYCHLGVIASTRRRTVINEETFDWNAVQLRKLLFYNMKERKIERGLKKFSNFQV